MALGPVCDLSIGGVGFGCVGNIAILALVLLIFVAAAVYCVCFRTREEPDSGPVQHSKADEEWSRAALAAAADSEETGLMSATSRSPSERCSPSSDRAAPLFNTRFILLASRRRRLATRAPMSE